MNKTRNIQLNKIYILPKFIITIMLSFYLVQNANANPKKIIKNVICKENSIFKKFLENNQNEKLSWLGISEDGSTITELYISRSTNSWTILETDTNGISCATIGGKESKYIMNNNY